MSVKSLVQGHTRSTCSIKRSYNYQMEKEMATHSSSLAWEILLLAETQGPVGLHSMGLQRVGHE